MQGAKLSLLVPMLLAGSCCPPEPAKKTTPPPVPVVKPPAPPQKDLALPEETHLQNVRQLTFGGDNAEAYWSFGGDRLILQTNHAPYKCDQIEVLTVAGGAAEAGLDRQGPHDLRVLPEGRSGDRLRVDARGSPGVPDAARHVEGLPVGPVRVRHLQRERRRLEPAQADANDAGLRRRGDGVPERRQHHLHVDAQRRSRAVADGRRRQEPHAS